MSSAIRSCLAADDGWTCMDPGGAPMRADKAAMEWAKAWKAKGPAPQKLGFIYMLSGDNGTSIPTRSPRRRPRTTTG
jgi:hypothetical protein